MKPSLRLALIAGATGLVILMFGIGSSSDDAYSDDPSDPFAAGGAYAQGSAPEGYNGEGYPGGGPGGAQRGRVTLLDRGLQMPIGTQEVPEGWTLTQDIATNPQNGEAARLVLDVRGPQGELIRSLRAVNYGGMMGGVPMDQAWQQAVAQGLQGEVEQVQFGSVQRSPVVEASPGFRRVAPRIAQVGAQLEGLEAPFRGQRRGQPVEGVVHLMHFFSPQMPGSGTVQPAVLVAPAGRLAEVRRAEQALAASFQPNPAHQQRVEQIGAMARQQSAAQHQQWMADHRATMQQSASAHQQRMAQSQAQFQAHQQRMQGMWDANDAQMQGWQAQQRSSDEMHRRTINGINGTADVYDATTGQTHYGVQDGAGAYWVDPTNNAVVGTDAYSDNPDPYRYNQGTNLDDLYNRGNDR